MVPERMTTTGTVLPGSEPQTLASVRAKSHFKSLRVSVVVCGCGCVCVYVSVRRCLSIAGA